MGRIPHTFSRYEAGSRYACSRVSPLKRLCEHLRSTFLLQPASNFDTHARTRFSALPFFYLFIFFSLSSSSSFAFDPYLLFPLILLLRVLFLLFFFFSLFYELFY